MTRAAATVLAALVAVLAGCSVAVDDGSQDGTSSAPPSSTASSTGTGSGTTGPAALDDCLLGRWTTVTQADRVEVGDEVLTATGVPRTLEFAADGVETVTYGAASAPVTRADGSVAGELTHEGSFRFRVTTDAGTMTFAGLDGEVRRVLVVDGETSQAVVTPTSDPVTYTCDATTLRQESDGYTAQFARAG